MKSQIIISGFAAILVLCTASASAAKPSTDKEKFSYTLGFQLGQGFKRDKIDINPATLAQAINDVFDGKASRLTDEEMRDAMEIAKSKILAAQKAVSEERKAMGEDANKNSQAFLAANKKKEGVVTRDSGLQYKVLKTGKGKQPKATDSITAHYKGTLINGQEFDSSYRRGDPATFGVNQVIKGWQEVLPLMHEGDKWRVFIPSELAYGERGSGNTIGPNEALIFEIELIKVN